MKIALALLALVATAASANINVIGPQSLEDDLQDFMKLIPVNEIVGIVLRYMSEDEEVQELVKYLQSDEFKGLVLEVEGMPEVLKLMNYIQNAGVDIYNLVNKLNEALGLPPIIPPKELQLSNYKTKGVRGLVDDIEAILPLDKLEALFYEKMETSEAWKDMIEHLSSDEFQQIVNNVYAKPKFQEFVEKLKGYGLDLQVIVKLLKEMLGIIVPTKQPPVNKY